MDGSVTTDVDSPSILTKRLNWLRPLMIEMSWRGDSLASALLAKTALKKTNYLYNEYKQVREKFSKMLALVFRYTIECRTCDVVVPCMRKGISEH